MTRVLVAGDANLDLVLRGDVVPRFGQAEQLLDGADLVLGSSAGICAAGLARLGVDTALVARGPDADAWLNIAQAFAGPPGSGREQSGKAQ